MKTDVSLNTQETIQDKNIFLSTQTIQALLGESDEFALLRETLWIYSQIVDSE